MQDDDSAGTSVPDSSSPLRLDRRKFVVIGANHGLDREVTAALHSVRVELCCVDIDAARADKADKVGGSNEIADSRDRKAGEGHRRDSRGGLG
jgi:hypothetical protein